MEDELDPMVRDNAGWHAMKLEYFPDKDEEQSSC